MTVPGVVHLGLGAFHRAHQALVFETLQERYGSQWSVYAFSMRNPAVAEQLAANHHRYHVRVSDGSGTRWKLCTGIGQVAVVAQAPQKLVAAIADAHTRWITLTVTEKGYTSDLANLLVKGLHARCKARHAGLTIASCDNLHKNGDHLRALCQAASVDQPALWDWIAFSCTFPNSMVDRIVPATTPALVQACEQATGLADLAAVSTESFWEWVLEDRLVNPDDAAVLRSAGVQVVADVLPYELAKLNLLNGSHSALACLGALLDIETVDQVIAQPDLSAWVEALMLEDLGPGLTRQDWPAYAQSLLRRFANPTLSHSVHQICKDLSQKIPQRWQAPILRARRAARMPVQLAFAAALAIRYWQGASESGQTYTMEDMQALDMHWLAKRHAGNATESVRTLGRLANLWGSELAQDEQWLETVRDLLQSIQDHGIRQTLSQLKPVGKTLAS